LHLDGLRYSLSMSEIAARRIKVTLDEIARFHEANQNAEEQVSSALLDAWSLIDMCHRARELVQSTPTLPHKLPGIQVFLRATSEVDDLRNYVQHFRSGIPGVPASWSPLWGSLSWIPTHDAATCYTIFTGNLVEGLSAPSISYDIHESRFTTEIILSTGVASADLLSLAACMANLRTSLVELLDQHPSLRRVDANTLIWKMSILRDPSATNAA